jgi:hypothetical protein
VAADAPENRAALAARGKNRVADRAEILGSENARQRIDESVYFRPAFVGLGKLSDVNFAGPLGERISADAAEFNRRDAVAAIRRRAAFRFDSQMQFPNAEVPATLKEIPHGRKAACAAIYVRRRAGARTWPV